MTNNLTRLRRPLARIRTDIVTILAARAERTLTDDERALIATATGAELQAAADINARLLDEDRQQIAALDRIRELTGPYFADLPAGSTFGDVMPLMADAERAELDALASTLPPDGTVIIPATA